MRKVQQHKILALIETLKEAQASGLYGDCQECALQVGSYIDRLEGDDTKTVSLLENYYELLYRVSIGETDGQSLQKLLLEIENSVKTELKPNKFKALFLPYYDNTWETMKSVYLAFASSPLFETEVVIIPILRNTNVGVTNIWEDYLTPAGIQNTHYDAYSFEDDLPDIVFFNQPYDGVNIPKFQSHNIRKYTEKMVYIPYGIVPINVQGKTYEDNYVKLDPIQRCNLYIAQSEPFREFYLKGNPLYRNTLPVGNPKQDCLYAAKAHGDFTHYPDWEAAIGNRRVIMLNTHYSSMLDDVETHPGIKRLIDNIARNDNLFLIWRPHPTAFIMKMSAMMTELLDFAQSHERMLVDRTPSILPAYIYSNAVVSLFPSSIIMDALFLDLPVFLLGRESSSSSSRSIPFYSALTHENYEISPKDDIDRAVFEPLDAFLEDVASGKDSMREARSLYRMSEFPNQDGSVASNILEYIKGILGGGKS